MAKDSMVNSGNIVRVALIVEDLVKKPSISSKIRRALLKSVPGIVSARVNAPAGCVAVTSRVVSATIVNSSISHLTPKTGNTKRSVDQADSIRLMVACIDALDAAGINAFNVEKHDVAGSLITLLTFSVQGMMCQNNCGATVHGAIVSALPGIQDDGSCSLNGCILHAAVSFATSTARVWLLHCSALAVASIISAIEAVGFDAQLVACSDADMAGSLPTTMPVFSDASSLSHSDFAGKNSPPSVAASVQPPADHLLSLSSADTMLELEVTGMSCAACVRNVEQALLSAEMIARGIRSARVALVTEKAEIAYASGQGLTAEDICRLVDDLGYQAKIRQVRQSNELNTDLPSRVHVLSLNGASYDAPQMTDASELCLVRRLRDLEGVRTCHVDRTSNRLFVVINDPAPRSGMCSSLHVHSRSALDISSPGAVRQVCRGPRDAMEAVRGLGHNCAFVATLKPDEVLELDPNRRARYDSDYDESQGQFGGIASDVALLREVAEATLHDPRYMHALGSRHAKASPHRMPEESADTLQWRRLLYVSLLFGGPVILLHLLGVQVAFVADWMMAPSTTAAPLCGVGLSSGQLLNLVLNTPLQFGVGYRYYRGAILSARHCSFGMDCLVVTGTSISFFYSIAQVFSACQTGIMARHVFFEASGMLITFVTMGKYMEAYSRGSTMAAVSRLLSMQPKEALLVRNPELLLRASSSSSGKTCVSKDGALQIDRVPVELLQLGDVLQVLPGQAVPTDGMVVRGSSHVDESMLTGESRPVRRSEASFPGSGQTEVASHIGGDIVFGSTLNVTSALYVEVQSLPGENAVSQIAQLVKDAQLNKAPVQELADRIAGAFTPVVLVLGGLTFICWYVLCRMGIVPFSWYQFETGGDPFLLSMLFAISVVVISCPCALGLATPMAILVGTTVAAECGMLIKGGRAFENANHVHTVVFDKTGTLTEGCPVVQEAVIISAVDFPDELAPRSSSLAAESSLLPPLELARERSLTQNAMHLPDRTYQHFTVPLLLLLAATAEQNTTHPLARAVLRANAESHAKTQDTEHQSHGEDDQARPVMPLLLSLVDPAAFSEEVGQGVSCTLPIALQQRVRELLVETARSTRASVVASDSVWMAVVKNASNTDADSFITTDGNCGVIRVGNRALMERFKIPVTPALDARLRRIEQSACTAVCVSYGSRVVGLLSIADPLKSHARSTVQYLRNTLQVDVWMATGDSPVTAAAVAAQLDLPIDRVLAGALPNAKVRLVEQLQHGADLATGGMLAMSSDSKIRNQHDYSLGDAEVGEYDLEDGISMVGTRIGPDSHIGGNFEVESLRTFLPVVLRNLAERIEGIAQCIWAMHTQVVSADMQKRRTVCMVGDGINDAPALAAADVGVAIGAGAHVAQDAADCILISADIRGVATCLTLARTVFLRIKRNFMWALAYNIIAIPFAAGLWYPWTRTIVPPQYAGLAMALSSVSVVLSSLALRWFTAPVLPLDRDPGDAVVMVTGSTVTDHRLANSPGGLFGKGLDRLRASFTPSSVRAQDSGRNSNDDILYSPLSVQTEEWDGVDDADES